MPIYIASRRSAKIGASPAGSNLVEFLVAREHRDIQGLETWRASETSAVAARSEKNSDTSSPRTRTARAPGLPLFYFPEDDDREIHLGDKSLIRAAPPPNRWAREDGGTEM